MRHTLLSVPRTTGSVSRAVKLTAIAVTLALLPSSMLAQEGDPNIQRRSDGYTFDYDYRDSAPDRGMQQRDSTINEGGYDAIDDRTLWYDPSTWVGRRHPTREQQRSAYFGYGHDRDYSTGYGRDYYEAFDETQTARQGYRGVDSGYRWYTDRWFDDNDDFYNWYD